MNSPNTKTAGQKERNTEDEKALEDEKSDKSMLLFTMMKEFKVAT